MSQSEPEGSEASASPSSDEAADRASARPRALLSEVLRSGVGRIDQGARAARRTVRRSKLRVDRLPLVGDDAEVELQRAELLRAMAERTEGSRRADLLVAAAELLERQSRGEAAEASLQQALQAAPEHALALRTLRRRRTAAGDLEAVARLAESEASSPQLSARERALTRTAQAEALYRGLSRPSEALAVAKQALEQDGEQLAAALLAAEIALDLGHLKDATEALEAAARAWPQARFRRALWVEAAGCHLQMREAEDAAAALKRAHEADPHAVDVMLELARAQRACGRTEDAVATLRQGAQLAPSTMVGEGLLRIAARWLVGQDRQHAALDLLQGRHQAATHRLRAEIARYHATSTQRRDALQAWARTSEGWEHALALLDLAEHFGRAGDLRRARDSLQQATAADAGLASMVAVQHAWQRGEAESVAPGPASERPLIEAARLVAASVAPAQEAALLENARDRALSVTIDTLHLDAALATGNLDAARESLQRRAGLATRRRRIGAWLALLELADAPDERHRLLQDARQDTTGVPLLLRALAQRADEPAHRARMWLEEYATASGSRAAFAATMAARCREEAGDDGSPQLLAASSASPGYAPAVWALTTRAAAQDDLALMRRVDTHLAGCARHPHIEAVHHARAGWLSHRLGEHAAAREHLDRALDGVGDVSLVQLRAQLAWEQPDLQGAQAALRAARSQDDPRLMRAWYHFAALLFEAVGHHREAAQLHRHALQAIDAGDVHAELALDRVETVTAEHTRMAQRLYRQIREARSVGARITALEALATLQAYDQADAEAAADTWNAILQSAPDHIPALRALERQFSDEGDDEALLPVETTLARQLTDRADAAAHLEMGLRLRRALGGYTGDPAGALLLRDGPTVDADAWLAAQLEGAARSHRDPEAIRHALETQARQAHHAADRVVASLRAAELLEEEGQLPRAAASLDDALQSSEVEYPVAYERLGEMWERIGDGARAAAAYVRAADGFAEPAHCTQLWHKAGHLWESAGEEEPAVDAFLHASRLDVAYRDVFERAKALLVARGADAELADLIERRLDSPGEPALLARLCLQLAGLRRRLGQPDAAARACAHALKLEPRQVDVLRPVAELLAELGHWSLAADALIHRARAERDPEQLHDTYSRLADIYEHHQPDAGRAAAALERVAALRPRDWTTLKRLAALRRRHGDWTRAESCLRSALESNPAEPEAHELSLRLAETLQAQGRHDEAFAAVEGVVSSLRVRLRGQADDIAAWKLLLEALAGREEAARCAASLAAAVGIRDESIVARLDSRGSASPAGSRAYGTAIDELLAPDELDATTRRVVYEAEPALRKLIPAAGLKQTRRLRRPSANLERALQRVCGWSGEREPRLVCAAGSPPGCMVASVDPLQLVLGEGLLARDDEAEQTFEIARAVKLAHTRLYVLTRGDPYDAAMAMLALIRACDPDFEAPVSDAATLHERTQRMARALSRKQKQRLQDAVSAMAHRPGFDVMALRRGARQLADRAAFVATGDGPVAMSQTLRRTESSIPTAPGPWSRVLRTHPEAASLFAFVLSDECARARGGDA